MASKLLAQDITCSKNFVYVVCDDNTGGLQSFVPVIDVTTNQVVVTVTLTDTVHPTLDFAAFRTIVTPDGARLYVTNQDDTDIAVVDTATNTQIVDLATTAGGFDIDVTPDGKTGFAEEDAVSPTGSGVLNVIDVATNAITNTIDEGNFGGAGYLGAFIKTSPDNKTVWLTGLNSGGLVAFDRKTCAKVTPAVINPAGSNLLNMSLARCTKAVYILELSG